MSDKSECRGRAFALAMAVLQREKAVLQLTDRETGRLMIEMTRFLQSEECEHILVMVSGKDGLPKYQAEVGVDGIEAYRLQESEAQR